MVSRGPAGPQLTPLGSHVRLLPSTSVVLNRGQFCPGGIWQILETRGARGWSEHLTMHRTVPTTNNNVPPVTMLPWCDTLLYTVVPLRKGTPGPLVYCPDWKGREMRHQQTWAGVQVMKEVTLSKSQLLSFVNQG